MVEGYKTIIGKYGEKLAAQFLERHGHAIIDKNFYTRYGEIDLIARNGDEILFCEVKTRTSALYGHPEEAVDYRKIQKLFKTIGLYLQEHKIQKFWRLDTISVEINKSDKKAHIRWFKDICIDK